MLNLLLLAVSMDRYEEDVRKVFNELGRLQTECPYGSFSEYGLVEPFLLLCLLKMTVDEYGTEDEAVERVRHELEKNDKRGLTSPDEEGKDPVLRLHREDMEKLLGSFAPHFRTSIYLFDRIAEDYATQYTAVITLEHFYFDPSECRKIFEAALRLAYRRTFCDDKSVNPSIAELARDILRVKDGESFMDFMCGTCLSTSVIIGDRKDVRIRLSDRDRLACEYAELYSRFSGINPVITLEDALAPESTTDGCKVDKIFVNPTIGEKPTAENHVFSSIRSEIPESVIKAADSLKEHGKAVVVLNSTFAYGSFQVLKDTRRHIVDCGFVSAVILLPGLFRRTNAPTLILVLTNEENDSILMVDWRDREKDDRYFYYEKKYMALVLRPDAEKSLAAIIRDRSGDGSRVVSCDEVRENGCNLLPSVYVEEAGDVSGRPMSEIEEDIQVALRGIERTIRELERDEERR